ncbi:MAG: hypothetical protein DMD83_18505 [Candidatus Rokuibacteriota bacterium]|nr:MAG: hypothetical protein DMD83_18505 [Candidatus Rokubacteria bacterium]
MADEDAALAAVQVAGDAFRRLDVVVKNAGYGDLALFEQVSSERFKALVDTNFYGVVNMTRAALPIMRKQKGGYILQISCGGGRLALAGSAAYHAAKWAVGDSPTPLAQEVAPLGVERRLRPRNPVRREVRKEAEPPSGSLRSASPRPHARRYPGCGHVRSRPPARPPPGGASAGRDGWRGTPHTSPGGA